MTRLAHGVLGANQHAVRVPVENVSTVVPACNIDLDQPGQWAAYFEFGLTEACTVHGAGSLRYTAFTAAFNRTTKTWHVQESKPGWDDGRCHVVWQTVREYQDSPDNFAEAVYCWSIAPLSWFTERFGQRYEQLPEKSCKRCI